MVLITVTQSHRDASAEYVRDILILFGDWRKLWMIVLSFVVSMSDPVYNIGICIWDWGTCEDSKILLPLFLVSAIIEGLWYTHLFTIYVLFHTDTSIHSWYKNGDYGMTQSQWLWQVSMLCLLSGSRYSHCYIIHILYNDVCINI